MLPPSRDRRAPSLLPLPLLLLLLLPLLLQPLLPAAADGDAAAAVGGHCWHQDLDKPKYHQVKQYKSGRWIVPVIIRLGQIISDH